MAHSELKSFILIGLLLATSINADGSCKKGCVKPDSGLLKYTPGHFYEYAFDSILTVGLSTGIISEADDTSLKVIGTAKVFANGNCDYTLQVGAIKVINTKQSLEKKLVTNIQKPVHFSWASGQVQPEICSDATDSEYALNIKRAIISLLQAGKTSESKSEVDVFGLCPTYTSISTPASGGETITKVRDLNQCAYREQINSGLLSGVVNEQAGIKSSSLLQADYSKEMKLQKGVIEHVHLVEIYKFADNVKGNSDVSAKVVTSLKLRNGAGGTPGSTPAPTSGQREASIIFQKYGTYTTKNIAALKIALSDLIDSTNDYVKKDTAKKFIEIIRLLRNSDTDTILELAAVPHPNKVLARKVYLDALFRTNTAESARAILKQLTKLSENEKLLGILSLNLVESVDKETLNLAAVQLLSNAPKELYLVVGNLISKFCLKNSCETSVIESISKKFVDGLKHCKANTKKDEERIVYVLKGIGNSHILVNSLVPALTECISSGRSNRIRVAALQAFSTSNCNEALNSKALEILKNPNEDSELRIEAYVTAVNCPTAQLANQISEIVNSEKVYQVGSFISSSLKVIRDSTDANRELQRYHLGNIRVTKQFPQDYRRYSFNRGCSYRLDALGLSASTDYKLIYSQHGFLPRSARFNMSAELFGTNFNVIEGNLRQENLEKLLEYYVGPKGLLNKDFDEIVKLIEVGNAEAAGGTAERSKRSIADDAAKIAKKYKTYGSKNIHDLNLDLSLKLFGSELAFLSLGDNVPSTLDDIIKYFSDAFDKTKKELSSFEKQFTSHHLFLDAELSYPTGLGVPLELGAQGFAANKIDFAINIDVNDILEQNWQRSKYRFKFVPSFDVNVNILLGFNAQVLSTGLRVVSTAHSATGSDVSVSLINNGEGFNVNVDLPREKLELVNVQLNAEFFIAENDKQLKSVPLKNSAKKQKSKPINEDFCFSQLDIVGVNLCISSSASLKDISVEHTQSEGHVDEFHLSKPFSLAIYSTSERKFNLKGTQSKLPTGSHQWKLDYSTPGSKVSHDTSVAFEVGTKPKTYGRIAIDNPQIHLAVEAGFTNDNTELVVYGQYEQNKDVKRSKIGFSKHGNEYKPLIEIHDKNGIVNNINGYRADGKINVQKSGDKQARFHFQNFQLLSPSNERIVINGWTDLSPNALSTELHIAPGEESYLVKSNFKLENGQYEAALFVNNERTPNNVYGSSVQAKIGNNAYDLQLIGQAFTWTLTSTSALKFVKGDNSNTLTSSQFLSDLRVDHQSKPYASVKVNTNFDVNKLEFDATAIRDQNHQVSVNVKYQSNQRTTSDYELLAKAKLNKHSIEVVSKCDANGNLLIVDNSIITSWGTLITVKGELGQRYTAQDVHIDLQGSAQFRSKEKALQWIFKALGAPEKTNGEFRVSRDNTELIKLTTESQHPLDKVSAAKFNLLLKNQLSAKGDFKIAKNGKGELTAIIETQNVEPQHKFEVDSKFQILSPKYDIDTSIKINGDTKLHFKTENIIDKFKFSTKNLFESDTKKVSLEANGALKGDWRSNGDILGAFTLVTPDGHVYDGNLNRHITTNLKTHLIQGTANVQVNEQQPGNKEKRSILLKTTLDTLNTKTKEFSSNAQLILTSFNDKKAELNSHVKYSLKEKGGFQIIDAGLSLQGNLVENQLPVELSIIVDEYSTQQAHGRISFKFGDRILANLNGNVQVGQQLNGVPASYELQADLQAPQTNFRSFELNSRGKLLRTVEGGSGPYNVEFDLNTKTADGHFTRINTFWKGFTHQGSYTFDAQSNWLTAPLKFDGSYRNEKDAAESNSKWENTLNTQFGDKYIKHHIDINIVENTKTATVQWQLDTSHESIKSLEVNIQSTKADEDTYAVRLEVKDASKKYEMDSKWFGALHKKGLELHLNLPKSQPIGVVAIVEILGERKAKVSVDIQSLADLDFKLNLESSYTTIDEFYIVGDWSSKKLQLNSYVLDIKAQNKSIKVSVTNAQDVIISGTATYNLKKDQNKAIIEGQGQFQKRGKTVSSSFKLTRQYFALSTEKEVGASYSLNGNVGPTNVVATLKLTNKEFNLKVSTCEEKRQCMNIQAQSTLTIDEKQLDTSEHGILVLMDLREIGYPYELEWKSRSRRQGFKHQYSLDGHISGNNLKYQLNINFLPNGSTIRLTLPKRQILFESTQTLPTDGNLFGRYEESVAFYIDKLQRPNDVARVSAILDISGEEHVAINSRLQLKIEHPTIRPLTVSGTFDADRNKRSVNSEFVFDIFKSPEQKIIAFSQIRNTQAQQSPFGGFDITSNHKIYSSGLRFNYEINVQSALNVDKKEFTTTTVLKSNNLDINVGANILANKDHVDVTVNALDKQIIAVSADIDWKKYSTKINSKLQALAGQNPIEIISELQPNWVKISLNKQSLMNANAEIKLGKEFKFDVTTASGKSVSNGRVSLDAANFLQTDYKVNEDDYIAFVNTLKNELKKEAEEVTEKLKKQFDNARSDFGEKVKLIKQSRPDFDILLNGYENQAETIIRELEVDPTLASIIDSTRKLIEKINTFINEISRAFAKHFEELHKTLEEVLKNWNELWKNSILKAWEQFVVSVTKMQENLREEVLNVYTKVFKAVVAGLEKYGPVLKNYAKALHESLKPVSEAVQELIKTIFNSADYIFLELKEYLSKLPTFDAIRTEIIEQIKHFKLIEKTLEVLNNIFDQLHILPQTPDTEEFLQKLHTYLEAKLKQQSVNDEKVLNELSQQLIKSLRSIWLALENSKPGGGIPVADLESLTAIALPTWLNKLINLPALLSFRSSVINALVNEKWENTLSKNLYATWLYSVIFQKFDLHGQIVDGHHVFTFDGQSYAYPGNCRYVLVQDSVDNNFTVIVQLSSESKLKAITLTDRDGNIVEVSDTVALKINGKPVEYPQHIPGIHAWRRFYGVYLHSEYGVTITCTTDLRVCQVTVDGFYTSKTRGLLGNGNAEPYDDFLLIDGTIAIDSATLGNDYGVGKCNSVSSKGEQQVVRNEICSEIFGIESTLALNYLQLEPRPYRKGCDLAVQDAAEKDKESVACNFALAYGSALKQLKQFSLLPPRCLKCNGAVGQRELGEEFTVKTPTNKADLVFVVDVNVTPKVLSQLVAPAITEIRDALKIRGFTDVQVSVIAFDESKRYPALLTSDNGKINYKANVASVQVNGPKNFCDNCVEQIITDKRVLEVYKLLERFVKTIVPQSDENAFSLALDYPFRAGAAKSIIGVRSDSLEYTNWWKLLRAHITGSLTKFDGAQLHLIAPIKGLALEGVPADKLVGFNSRLVATLDGKDNKKRSKLQFENDMGIDFVLNNGGWAFTTLNFDRLKSADQKKVLNQVTSSIADTLFKTETISDCRCVPVGGLFGQHKCAIKSTSFLPNKKSKSA